MFHFMSSLVTWDVVILVLKSSKHMFGCVTFNMKYYILSQIFYKKNWVDVLWLLETRVSHGSGPWVSTRPNLHDFKNVCHNPGREPYGFRLRSAKIYRDWMIHYNLYAFAFYLVHSLFGLDPGRLVFMTKKDV